MPLISKRKVQLNDARASKNMKMKTETIHLHAQKWVQALQRHDKMSYVLLHDILLRQLKLISEASRINGENN